MSEEPQGVFVPFDKLFGDLSESLKQGFDKLDKRMERFEQQLALKADNTRVADLSKQIADHELRTDERFKPLEVALVGSTAVSKVKDKGLVFLSGVAIAVISALTYLAATGGFH